MNDAREGGMEVISKKALSASEASRGKNSNLSETDRSEKAF